MKVHDYRKDLQDDRDEPWADEAELDHEKENLDLAYWNNRLKVDLVSIGSI